VGIGSTITEGSGVVIDVKLRVDRRVIYFRKKGSSTMNKLSMKLESIRTTAVVKGVIKVSTNRSHRKGTVIVTDVVAKRPSSRVLSSKQGHKVSGRWV
jgi:hypothetical protein